MLALLLYSWFNSGCRWQYTELLCRLANWLEDQFSVGEQFPDNERQSDMTKSGGGCYFPRLQPNKDPGHRACPCGETRRGSFSSSSSHTPCQRSLIFRRPSSLCVSLSTMSALRALRQLTASSSRSLAGRTAARSVARATLAARVAPVASRAFSVSARRFGEGACEY